MSLRNQVLSGLFWTGGGRALSQIVNWSITIVVIRLLSPADYGLLAIATLFLNFLMMFAEAGLGPALIQAPELDDSRLRGIFGAVILIDCILFGALVAAAPIIAGFFAEPRLVAVISVLAVQILLSMFSTIPSALLARALDFKRPSMIGLVSTVCGSLTTLALALSNHGVWALVLGNLASQCCSVLALNLISPFLKLPDFSMRDTRLLLGFGWRVTAGRVLWFAYSQADIVIAGKMLGKELLGIYSVSMHLASLPVQKISSVFNQVAFPAFASVQEDRSRVATSLLKAIRLVSLIAFPLTWGLSSVSHEAVEVLLGAKWEAAAVPLQLIALVMPFRVLSTLLPSATDGIGRADIGMTNVFVACLVMPVAFFIGCRWGILGLSAAWVLVYPLVVLQNVHRVAKAISMKSASIWLAAAPSLAASGIVYLSVTGLGEILPPSLPGLSRFIFLIAGGAIAYGCATWAMNRRGAMELWELVRR